MERRIGGKLEHRSKEKLNEEYDRVGNFRPGHETSPFNNETSPELTIRLILPSVLARDSLSVDELA